MSVETNRAGGGAGQAMQLKLSLRGVVKPPVWRRLLVPADIRLDRVHEVIPTAIGWTDTHLHVFSTQSGDYGIPDPELGHRNERNARLAQVLQQPGDRIHHSYDLGDGWEHDIVLENRLRRDRTSASRGGFEHALRPGARFSSPRPLRSWSGLEGRGGWRGIHAASRAVRSARPSS